MRKKSSQTILETFLKAPTDSLFDMSSALISAITIVRVQDKFWFNVRTFIPLGSNASLEFRGSWGSASLLVAIWLLFYFKITGQIEQSFIICPVCNEPIINPGKNQTYCKSCRQTNYNRIIREAIKAYKEGKSISEIAHKFDKDEKQINRCIAKERLDN